MAGPNPIPRQTVGRGDKRTAKGKRFSHSFGKSRPKTQNPPAVKKAAPVKKTAGKK